MAVRFAELDWQSTDLGDLVLRRRFDPLVQAEVYEVKLGDEFLMSSLFTAAEIELAALGLVEASGDRLDVVVGGLGLGYTACAALSDPRVATLTVVEALRPVIEWHQRGLLPHAAGLAADERVRFVYDDFFALAGTGFGGHRPHAVLVDIDHSPRHLLDPNNAGFYTTDGLRRLGRQLREDAVFALWSNDPPDTDFLAALSAAFATARAEVITFANPFQDHHAANTIYIATRPAN